MKRLMMVSAVLAGTGLGSGMVLAQAPAQPQGQPQAQPQAQPQGKVISSTPVLRRVTEPRTTCSDDAEGKQRCTTQMVTEDRQIGYKVVYEYAGRTHEAQLPFAPGPTIPLEVSANAVSPAEPSYVSQPTPYYRQPQPTYGTDQPATVVVREPVYVEPAYYPARYYYPGYYYDPLYPIVGLAVGYSIGSWWGHGWRGPVHHVGGHFRR